MTFIPRPAPTIQLGVVTIWLASLHISNGLTGSKIHMSDTEGRTLLFLLAHKDTMVPKTEILFATRGVRHACENIVDTSLSRIRSLLEQVDEGASRHIWSDRHGAVGLYERRAPRRNAASVESA